MTNTCVISDIHGELDLFNPLYMTPGCIQLGDLSDYGYGSWMGCDEPRFFIDGNHDDHSVLDQTLDSPNEVASNLFHIPRGMVDGQVLFVGGSESMDKESRILNGQPWFASEGISKKDMERIFSITERVEVVISHDCPGDLLSFLPKDFSGQPTSSEKWLNLVLSLHRPKLWIFGHHHIQFEAVYQGCRFVCLPSGDKRNFELPLSPEGPMSKIQAERTFSS